MNIPLPFLPVHGAEEYKLFSKLVLFELKNFDADKIALLWIDHLDGISIFPKLPAQLRQYYKVWQRNRRVQSAVRSMTSEKALLERMNKEHLPLELMDEAESTAIQDDLMVVDDSNATDFHPPLANPVLQFQRAVFAPSLQQPTFAAM
jgi:hypothetical protein